MRKLCMLALIAAVAVPASAAVINGDFEATTGNVANMSINGWTTWRGGWGGALGSGELINPDTTKRAGAQSARIQLNNAQGSFGIFQIVDVPANTPVDFQSFVRVTGTGTSRWAEALVFNYAATASDIDSGTISGPYLAWKRDDWTGAAGVPGGKLPTVASAGETDSWEKVNKTVTSPTGKVTIAFKWGSSGANVSASLRVDDVTLTPEPAALALLGLPMLLMVRRRR
jgi:hypothetical protein